MFQEPQQGNENELMHAKDDQQYEKVKERMNESASCEKKPKLKRR